MKVKGECGAFKSKKRKLDISVDKDTSSNNPQREGPFGLLFSQLDTIQELVSHFPRGSSQVKHITKKEMKAFVGALKKYGEAINKMESSVSIFERPM